MSHASRPSLCWALVVTCALVMPGAAHGDTPASELRRIFAEANRILADPASERPPGEQLSAVLEITGRAFAFPDAAQRALGAAWDARTPGERHEFVGLFTEFLQRAFVLGLATRMRPEDGLHVAVHHESIAGETATVHTTLATRHGKSVAVDYRMVRSGDRWMIGDVVLEGISLVGNYRAQVSRLLRDGSYADLLTRMKARTVAMSAWAAVRTRADDGEAGRAESTPVASQRAGNHADVAEPVIPPPAGIHPAHGVTAMAPDTDPTGTPVSVVASLAEPAPAPLARSAPRSETPVASQAPGRAVRPVDAAPSSLLDVSLEVMKAVRQPAVPDQADELAPVRVAVIERSTATPLVRPSMQTPRVEPSPPPRPVHGAGPVTTARPSYWVQVGAFKVVETAHQLAEALRSQRLPVRMAPIAAPAGETGLIRVRVGPFADRASATATLERLREGGHTPFVIVDRAFAEMAVR